MMAWSSSHLAVGTQRLPKRLKRLLPQTATPTPAMSPNSRTEIQPIVSWLLVFTVSCSILRCPHHHHSDCSSCRRRRRRCDATQFTLASCLIRWNPVARHHHCNFVYPDFFSFSAPSHHACPETFFIFICSSHFGMRCPVFE
jgi:hypothetical protein